MTVFAQFYSGCGGHEAGGVGIYLGDGLGD